MTSTLQSILRSGAAVLAAASMLALGVPASYADGAVNARNITAQSQADVAPAADSVASIGDATYPTLADAIAAATEGQTVTLTADSAESVTIKTAITITAANNAVFTGSMRINADGTAVKGMAFKLDPATNKNAQNVIVSKAADVTVTGNTFTIAAGDPATGASANKDWQPSSVWLESGAARTVISDNTFALGQVVNNSAVGVNLVGNGKAPIADTVVERNTVTTGPISGTGSSGSMMFVVGNGNTTKADTEAGTYGITGLRFAGNTVTNGTGLAAKVSRTYPIAVTATKGTVIENNTMEGYMGVSYSVWPSQGPNDGLTVTGNAMDTYVGVWMTQYDASGNVIANYVTDRGLTAKGNTFGENTEIQIRGANVVASDQDGKTYESLAAAVASGATGVQLIADTTLDADVAIGADITLDLNGKTITTAGFTINVAAGTGTINGAGSIINDVAAEDDDMHAMLDVAKGASLVITDGTFTAEGAPVASVEGTLTVNGGAFSAAKAAIIVLPEGDGASLTVNGGAYKAGTTAISALAGSNTLAVAGGDFDVPVASFDEEQAYVKYITGGTFASNPGQSTIADGKKFVQNDAGRWVLADATIASVEPLADITVAAGTDPTQQLPATVTVKLDNGLTREGVAVTWNAVPDTWKGIDGGEFTVDSATVDGSDAVTATQKVIVTAATPQGVANDGKVGVTIKAGDTLELPAQLDVIWSNGQTLPADVAWEAFDAALTAKPGTFTVKGTIDAKGTTLDVTATVTVEAVPVESVTITPGDPTVTVGETVALTATVAPDNATDKTVTWASSDEGIATVGADGVVTAVAEGTATITATVDGKTATVTVTVKAKPIECTPLVFADVTAETPHRDDIDWLSCQGVTEGYDNGDGTVDFGGMRTVVRQDMAAFLYRMAGSPEFTPSDADKAKFTDVTEATPHAKEIWWLASTGIATGYRQPDGTTQFGGMRTVVRQDMAAFLRRLADYQQADPSLGEMHGFTDVNAVTPYADDIKWLARTGVTSGYEDGSFGPMRSVVRQDMAAFLHRMSTNVLGE